LHVREHGPREEQLPELVRSLEPDLILYTGDFFAGGHEVEPIVSDLLNSWHVPQYACEGNLDDLANLEGTLQGANVKLLREQRAIEVIRNARVCIYGIAEGGWSLARSTMRDLPEDMFSIVLCHRPGSFQTTWNMRADLVLSGHIHGGQVRLPWYGALVTLDSEGKKYEWGRFEHDGTTLIVSRGIGCEPHDPEVRFLCPPEVVVIDVVGAGRPVGEPSA
jgi:predicted MPP superfamily phosphohydrolase